MAILSEKQNKRKLISSGINRSVDDEIDAKYEKGEQRILTEMNREKLPGFASSLDIEGYMQTRPFYQRRDRWDEKKQSKLIESFLINIPVPPIILYEQKYNSYEVIDGQQRISAIKKFYNNELKLTGLEIWSELNGRTYQELPRQIKAGIDRRSISSIVLITESTSDLQQALFLKQIAFERLNTGGVKLSQQEIRNCLYSGEFNTLILKLSENHIFMEAWGIPKETNKKDKNNLYKKMEDVELILRFFAFQNVDGFSGGNIKHNLDLYAIKSLEFSSAKIKQLETLFLETLELAKSLYGNTLFKPFNPKSTTWKTKPYKAYYDAVMVGLSSFLGNASELQARKDRVIESTKEIFRGNKANLLTGEGKTKAELQERIKLFKDMLAKIVAESA